MTAVAFAATAVGANDFFGIIIAVALAGYLMFILIAAELYLSANTVETHLRNLYLKARRAQPPGRRARPGHRPTHSGLPQALARERRKSRGIRARRT